MIPKNPVPKTVTMAKEIALLLDMRTYELHGIGKSIKIGGWIGWYLKLQAAALTNVVIPSVVIPWPEMNSIIAIQ